MKKINKNIVTYILCLFFVIGGVTIVAQANPDPEEENGVECNCGLIWGSGCSSANHGNSCAPSDAEFCSTYDSNCD